MIEDHTPEPWGYGSFHRLLIVPMSGEWPNKHDAIADLGETEFPFNLTPDSTRRYANARRIVACVNALKNVSTEWLEAQSGIVCLGSPIKDRFLELEKQRDDLLTENERAVQEINNWKARAEFSYQQRSNLEKQRDELLAELEDLRTKLSEANHNEQVANESFIYTVKQRDELLAALESMNRDYVNLLENARDRIIFLGGECDPLDVMERNDPALRKVRAVIASVKGQS